MARVALTATDIAGAWGRVGGQRSKVNERFQTNSPTSSIMSLLLNVTDFVTTVGH